MEKSLSNTLEKSSISDLRFSAESLIYAKDILEGIFLLIQKDFPDFDMNSRISFDELNFYRRKYLSSLLQQEYGDVAKLDQDVMKAIEQNSIMSEFIEDEISENLTLGQKIADRIAEFGGSWTFIISFFLFILIWISVNSWMIQKNSFDPFPFILLNLLLSCLAAIQAPIIMMSQNRQEQKDRQRSEHDYKINLKAEIEIKLLNEKIDHLIIHHNKKLLEIQELQTDYLEDLIKEIKKK